MRTVVLARHATTSWNRAKRIQGSVDIELDEGGRNEAQELSFRLRNLGITKIISSDLKRTHETANIIAQQLNVPVVTDSRLRECSYGALEGKTFEEARRCYSEIIKKDFSDFEGNFEDYDFRILGGEDKKSVLKRHQDLLKDFCTSEGIVLFVGHGRGLNTLLVSIGSLERLKHGGFCIVELE